jgi:uncharacterized protein (TIGR03435 family)
MKHVILMLILAMAVMPAIVTAAQNQPLAFEVASIKLNTSASGTMLVLSGNAVALSRLATTLQGLVQRPVIDKTNLNGFFDFRIRFSPQAIPAFPDRVPTADGLPAAPSDHPLIPILQEEFGLKLQPGIGPVEVLVIDHAERPSEN